LYQNLDTNNILVDTNNILVNKQSGFGTKSSTVKATFNLISELLEALNN